MIEPSGARHVWPSGNAWPEVRATHADGDHALRLELRVAPNVSWFDGHFPGHPVLPGIVQLHWAVGFARAAWPGLDGARGVQNLKFRQPVLPGSELSLRLDLDPDTRTLRFGFGASGQPCSTGRVQFQ